MTDVTAPAAERCRKLVRRSTVPRQTAAALQGTVPVAGTAAVAWLGVAKPRLRGD